MTSFREGGYQWDLANRNVLTLFQIRFLNAMKSLNNIIYGRVIVGVPETPACVTVATMITPSLAPVAVSVNWVPVLADITKVPFAFDESDPNTVTSDTPTKLLAPPPNAAGLRQYAAAADATLFTSCKSASRSALTAPVVNILIPTTTATPTIMVPSTISSNCCCPIFYPRFLRDYLWCYLSISQKRSIFKLLYWG